MPDRKIDPALDLVLQRHTHVPVELVWKAWTTPELLMQWFTPKPWKTVECDIELWPGGRFYTVMESPEGDRFPGEGCILEAIPQRRFAWTSALLPGFRPLPPKDSEHAADFPFSAIIELEPAHGGTIYTATAIHADSEAKVRHEEMGFENGWGSAFDQLVELMSR